MIKSIKIVLVIIAVEPIAPKLNGLKQLLDYVLNV